MTEREKFGAWLDSPAGNTDLCIADTLNAHPAFDAWSAWQACAAEKGKEIEGLQAAARFWNDKANAAYEELAASQARVKELEECYEKVSKEITVGERYSNIGQAIVDTYPHTTTPDQALQRALLDARIDEHEIMRESHATTIARVEELRAKRAELGE